MIKIYTTKQGQSLYARVRTSDILKNDVRFTDSSLKCGTGRHSEYRIQRV